MGVDSLDDIAARWFGAAAKRIGHAESSAQAGLRNLDGGQHLCGRELVDPLLTDWLRTINPRP